MRVCDNVSCVSLGRARRPRAAVAARGPEGLVRKSSPPDTGRRGSHSNQHKREQGGRGLVGPGGLVGGRGNKRSV